MRRISPLLLGTFFSLLFTLVPQHGHAFNPNYLLSDFELTDRFSLDLNGVQRVLERGVLSNFVTEDVDGKRRFAADIIWRAGQRNGVSPKVIITMLQKEQSLIEDPDPAQSQFDWAMGYAVCDSCTHDDPHIQRFRGFAKQINSATLQLTDGYLADLASVGQTVTGYAPGKTIIIDDTPVTFANDATAALYTYTPHIHGNRNFVKIFQRYFGQQYPTGTLLRDGESEQVYLIQFGKKRPIFSDAALRSRYNEENIIEVNPSVLEPYPQGVPIAFPNYSLLTTGEATYLLVDDVLRPFETTETPRRFGFLPDEEIEVDPEDIALYERGVEITEETRHPNGILYQHTESGSYFFVIDGKWHPVASLEILENRYGSRRATQADTATLSQFQPGDAIKLREGTLVHVEGDPTVYVISNGTRRAIPSEEVFNGMGWKWENIKTISQETLNVHQPDTPIEGLDDTDLQTAAE